MKKIDNGHPLSQSADFVAQNIETLKTLFPTIVKEGKIDIKELQALLGDDVETEEEYYRFTWAGKSMARREVNKPSTATLRPDKESSKDWDTTQNIFIEGDNLEVLKLLQKSYANKIKLIYIDPPYNTGKDFVYKDNYNDNLGNYLAITGQVDEEGKRINTNSESDGRYHSNWLNMMYPRLKLARTLLTDDGLIFISIDFNELQNLISVCNEIYGEDNLRNIIAFKRGAKSVQAQFDTWDKLGVGYEFVLMYSKSSKYRFKKQLKKLEDIKSGSWNNHWRGTDRPTMRYEIFGIIPPNGQWRWSRDRSKDAIQNYERMLSELKKDINSITDEEIDLWYKDQEEEDLDLLRLSVNGKPEHYVPSTDSQLLNDIWFDIPPHSSRVLKNLFNKKIFDNPKPIALIARILNFSENDSVILDFFAGSGTTAHATLQLNSEDAGNRKFICVQLPEPTDEKSEAYKAGYMTISEITKERIRRAGDKIKSEMKEDLFSDQGKTLDVGFRAFKLDSSNIRAWDGNPDALEDNLFNAESNIKENRTEEDILYEILLKYGLDLTMPIEQIAIAGKQVFNIGMGALFICLGDNITTAVAEGIGKWKEELQPATSKVIFKDNGFTVVEKTNSMQILKRYGILEVNTI
jgi:adenine-specific DNA-methyltransferase